MFWVLRMANCEVNNRGVYAWGHDMIPLDLAYLRKESSPDVAFQVLEQPTVDGVRLPRSVSHNLRVVSPI